MLTIRLPRPAEMGDTPPPSVQTKRAKMAIKQAQPCSISKDGRWFRLVCEKQCFGGRRFFASPGRALRAWNGAQIGKSRGATPLALSLRLRDKVV
ncbi:hypothetical protein CNECB9_2370141 [Cupriavidus necator]|uniref:Uncharacterized protein n=1 Tax=Cupriavidus necator TaxID=106590 RepID=A0A1K0IRN1_CUPNE|nr:hypothetical protein CNECB9_2370141 [Cupriavidus necator]